MTDWRKYLDVMSELDLDERFWVKVQGDGDMASCWVWGGALVKGTGYGMFTINAAITDARERTQVVRAHRYAWEFMNGPVPEGLQLDHLCRNRACCNPWHLQPVTPLVNTRRGIGHGSETQCPQGHPYDEANTYTPPGTRRRYCRTCQQGRRDERRAAA